MALKVGLVGLHGIGNKHADCYRADDLAELVGVCDVVKERADKAAAKHNVKAYYSLDEMLDAIPDLDIVDVSTGGIENGSWHFEPAMQAMEAGKHVLVEKPLSNCINEARQMVAMSDDMGVYLGCNLNHFFTPPADRAMQYINENKIGQQLYCIHKMCLVGGEFAYTPKRGARDGRPYFHMKAFLTHPFSVMRHFCGDITHVQAFCDQTGRRRDVGEVLVTLNSIHVRFANGCTGYLLSHRNDGVFGLGGWWSVEVGGTRGTFCIENCVEKVTFFPTPGSDAAGDAKNAVLGKAPEPIVDHSGHTDFGDTFAWRIHAFLEDVSKGVAREKLRANGRDALAALEYTWAAIESYEQGGALVRPHPLPELKGDPRKQG